MKLSDIRGLWKKKTDVAEEPSNTEENVDSVDTLMQLLILAVPVPQVSQKRHRGRLTY